MKHWAGSVALAVILPACQPSDSGSTLNTGDGVVVLKDEVVRVEVTDELITHGVRTVVTNGGPDTTVVYRANLNVDRRQWHDSLVLYLETGDTITGEIVFGDAPYSEGAHVQLKGSLHPITTP